MHDETSCSPARALAPPAFSPAPQPTNTRMPCVVLLFHCVSVAARGKIARAPLGLGIRLVPNRSVRFLGSHRNSVPKNRNRSVLYIVKNRANSVLGSSVRFSVLTEEPKSQKTVGDERRPELGKALRHAGQGSRAGAGLRQRWPGPRQGWPDTSRQP